MTPKENALRILRFNQPAYAMAGLPSVGLAYRGCNGEGYDCPGHDVQPAGAHWIDIWGTARHKELPGVMGFPRGFPLADKPDPDRYAWPDPDDERICGPIYQRAERIDAAQREAKFIGGSHRATLWEKAYAIASMETMMESFYLDPPWAREVLRRVMDFQLGIARHYLAVGIAVAGLGDDLGTQIAPLLGPAIVREFLVPEYRRLIGLYKQHGVIINFHSCGHIEEMLEIFMELGIDVLNPVQATANDLTRVRAVTQGKMALQGAIATDLVMKGPPEAIRLEVRRRLWQLGREGGYFPGPDQGMPFPPENTAALHAAVAEFGQYPLQPPA